MKKIVLRTIWITLGVALILGISIFGILSFCAPAVMMDFSASLGLTGISGDYAYQEYLQSGDIACLAHAFETAASSGRDLVAETRFDLLYENEGFDEFCTAQDQKSVAGAPKLGYRSTVCGYAAEIKYRLAETEEDKDAVCDFAIGETNAEFPAGNPVYFLANEAAEKKDGAFCTLLAEKLRASDKFSQLRKESLLPEAEQSEGCLLFVKIIEILEGIES